MSKSKKITDTTTGYIISNPESSRKDDSLQLLRIIITSQETKLDFGYQATSYYKHGGWIKISPNTFIRPSGTNKKFILVNATNIPYGPEKLHFNSSIEWRYFSLHFPALADDVEFIDLIERERGDESDFNFYNIRLKDEKKKASIY